jgi:hypothetical protein
MQSASGPSRGPRLLFDLPSELSASVRVRHCSCASWPRPQFLVGERGVCFGPCVGCFGGYAGGYMLWVVGNCYDDLGWLMYMGDGMAALAFTGILLVFCFSVTEKWIKGVFIWEP